MPLLRGGVRHRRHHRQRRRYQVPLRVRDRWLAYREADAPQGAGDPRAGFRGVPRGRLRDGLSVNPFPIPLLSFIHPVTYRTYRRDQAA